MIGNLEIKTVGEQPIQEGSFVQLSLKAKWKDNIFFKENPQVAVYENNELLEADTDYKVSDELGQIKLTFLHELEGEVAIKFKQLQIYNQGDIRTATLDYYDLKLKHNLWGEEKESILQMIPYSSGYNFHFGGNINLTADSLVYERYGTCGMMEVAPYIDEESGAFMVPVKAVLLILEGRADWMSYKDGVFEAYVPCRTSFTVGSKVVKAEEDIELTHEVILKNGKMYMSIDDLAKVFSGAVRTNPENEKERRLIISYYVCMID